MVWVESFKGLKGFCRVDKKRAFCYNWNWRDSQNREGFFSHQEGEVFVLIIQKDNTIKYKDISTQIKTTKFLEDKDSKGKVRDWKGK